MGRVQFLGGSNSVKEAGAVEEIVGVLVQFLHPGNDGELEQAERAGEVLRPPVLVHRVSVLCIFQQNRSTKNYPFNRYCRRAV